MDQQESKTMDPPAPAPKKKENPIIQGLKILGMGYFIITFIGILSFTLLFFILWFM